MDHDQLASEKPADLDLHCFQNGIILLYSWVHTWQQLRCHKPATKFEFTFPICFLFIL